MNPADPCPVRCAGCADDALVFITPLGRREERQFGELLDLKILSGVFDGQEGWLRRNFPLYPAGASVSGNNVVWLGPSGVNTLAAAAWLCRACETAEFQANRMTRAYQESAWARAWRRLRGWFEQVPIG